MRVIVKIKCFYNLQFTIKTKKIQHIILETFTKKNSLRNLTWFHGGHFEFVMPEIFTTAFLLKTTI